MRLLKLIGHRPRRSQPLLINAGFHTVEVALSVSRSGRQAKRLTFEELAEFKVTQCVRRLIAQNMGNLRLQG